MGFADGMDAFEARQEEARRKARESSGRGATGLGLGGSPSSEFEMNLAAVRAKQQADREANELLKAQRLQEESEAEQLMRRMSVDFARRADAIGFGARRVVTFRSESRRIRTGIFKSAEHSEDAFGEFLGEGWIVVDTDPVHHTEYGDPYTQMIVLRDGRWIDAGIGGSHPHALESPQEARRANRPRGGSHPWVVSGLPKGFEGKDVIGCREPVVWVRRLEYVKAAEEFLIETLLRAERR